MRVIHLQNQVDTLQSINASLRLQTASSIVSDSTLARYANLSRKVEELDHRAASREKALQRVVKDAQEQHQRETERLVNLHQEELREKDDDIRNCKMQIDKWKKAVVLSSESQNAITRYSSAI